jgi:shikimate kinase / 3-dehydroquinate synthase
MVCHGSCWRHYGSQTSLVARVQRFFYLPLNKRITLIASRIEALPPCGPVGKNKDRSASDRLKIRYRIKPEITGVTRGIRVKDLREALGRRSIVLVGLMGCGKTSVGRRMAMRLGLPFVDVDEEIEISAQKTINEIFADHGEPFFRDGERRVIARLLANGPQVLATGGGAFINAETRNKIKNQGISVWLKADLPLLMRRVSKRDTRPLLRSPDPETAMRTLMKVRYPIYALADLAVESRDVPHDHIVTDVIEAVRRSLQLQRETTKNLTTETQTMVERGVMAALANATTGNTGITAAPLRTVPVPLPGRDYDCLIGAGLIADAGRLIAERFGPIKCAIVTDANVAHHHATALESALRQHKLHAGTIILPPGEATKSFGELQPLCEQLLAMGLERGDLVIPFGGGVIGDLAGFAASLIRRGVRFVQIPTSLLAQVDSSVGGKTGINTVHGKNLIGTFHQPSLVLADTNVLSTLPDREMRAGYAEVVKYGLLGDATFFHWLEANWRALFDRDRSALTHAIVTSVSAKAAIVLRDEHETGDRALLNLGHTFGHALEAWTGYSSRLLHGEGVAIGMCLAFRLSEQLGFCPVGTAGRVSDHLKAVGLPTTIADIAGGKADPDQLLALMGQDKKVKAGRLTFIMVRTIGEAFVTRDIEPTTIRAFLAHEIG